MITSELKERVRFLWHGDRGHFSTFQEGRSRLLGRDLHAGPNVQVVLERCSTDRSSFIPHILAKKEKYQDVWVKRSFSELSVSRPLKRAFPSMINEHGGRWIVFSAADEALIRLFFAGERD